MRSRHAVLLFVVALGPACATARGPAAVHASADGTALRGLAHEALHATLWMQTAAEYDVLARRTFERAGAALVRGLADRGVSAALEQAPPFEDKPPAVIVDIDETMLDNSPMQVQIALEGTDYCAETWRAWVAKAEARAVPGAVEFAQRAAALGVRVLYVTNRTAAEKADTLRNLRCAGREPMGACLAFPVSDPSDVVALGETPAGGSEAWTSDKTKRRAYLAERYRIVLLVGDDLRDFVSVPAGTDPAGRTALARQHAARWDEQWFLLPNAMYGSWDRSLYPSTVTGDEAILRAKRAAGHGFRAPVAGACSKP